MPRLLGLATACLISGAVAFGQGTVTEQSPVTSGTQAKTLHTNPNGNGRVPQTAQGRALPTPSSPNQELPGSSNPANAATSDAAANGQAVRPNSSQSGTPGTGAGNPANGSDHTDNGIQRNGVGKNPVNGSIQTPTTDRGTFSVGQWFWIALAFVVGLIVIGVLASRRRAREEIDSRDLASRITSIRRGEDRRDDQIRKAG